MLPSQHVSCWIWKEVPQHKQGSVYVQRGFIDVFLLRMLTGKSDKKLKKKETKDSEKGKSSSEVTAEKKKVKKEAKEAKKAKKEVIVDALNYFTESISGYV